MEEEKKQETSPSDEGEKKKPGRKAAGVSKEEFIEFQGQVTTALGSILEQLKNQPKVSLDSEGVHVSNTLPKEEGGSEKSAMVPPAWRKLTDEILGSEFDIELDLPENGGQHFIVHVPKEKSNAGKDHWDMYKRDKRTRELGNTGIRGVKEWLLRIRKNLIASGIKLSYYEDMDPRVGIMLR
jgi:hypothetical protein